MNQGLGGNQRGQSLPAELQGFSWAAFLWGGIWALGHRVWIGLLAFVPIFGLIMNVVLGLKGTRWAWENGAIQDVARFKKAQRMWLFAWIGLVAVMVPISGVFSALAIVGVKQYLVKAKRLEAPQTLLAMVNGMK